MDRDRLRFESHCPLASQYRVIASLVIFACGVVVCASGQVSAGETVITFSEFPLGNYVTDQYANKGIIFRGIDLHSAYPPFISVNPQKIIPLFAYRSVT